MADDVKERLVDDGSDYLPPPAKGRPQALVEATCNFIECLTVPTGHLMGQRFNLLPFQRRFIRDVYGPTKPDGSRLVRRAILSMARKNGKALCLATRLPTPRGWTTIGNIRVGDVLFDETGAQCRVTFATPVQLDRDCFRVSFSDGTSVVADADHQWTVYSRSRNGKQVTLTTADMVAKVVLPYSRRNRVERDFSVDVAKPVDLPEADLPIPPYTLGVWLGDGKSSGATIYIHDDDRQIIEGVVADGFPCKKMPADYEWSISDGVRIKNRTKDCLLKRLRTLGVIGNKHIPESYLRASITQRLSLLQGLMDTDGHATKRGQCEIVSVKHELAAGVLELARSLGHKATLVVDRARLNGRDCGPRYRVQFWGFSDLPVFRLDRKRDRLKERPARSRNGRNYIVGIDRVDSVPVRCIQVDSPSSLFLVGDGFTPTHNTALIAALALAHLVGPLRVPNSTIIVAANEVEQAGLTYDMMSVMIRRSRLLSQIVALRDFKRLAVNKRHNITFKTITAKAITKLGAGPALIIYDEIGSAPNRALYDVLRTSQGTQANPLFIMISTQSATSSHFFSELVDDGRVVNAGIVDDPRQVMHLYALPTGEDMFEERNWKKANPGLDVICSRELLRAEVEQAARLPSSASSTRNFYFNQREHGEAPFMSRDVWNMNDARPSEEVFKTRPVAVGVDLSTRQDLSAIVFAAMDDDGTIHLQPHCWLPGATVLEHMRTDRAPYDVWIKQGFVHTTPGNEVDYDSLAEFLNGKSLVYDIAHGLADRWRLEDLKRALRGRNVDVPLEPFDQGFKGMSPAIEQVEILAGQGRLAHGGHPVLQWCVANATTTPNTSGFRRFAKIERYGRIDLAVAMTMAVYACCSTAMVDASSMIG